MNCPSQTNGGAWRGRSGEAVHQRKRPGGPDSDRRGAASKQEDLLLDDREDVARGEDQELLARVLDLGAAVLAVDDLVADRDVERNSVAAVVDPTRTHSQDFALLGLLLG